MEIRDLMQYTDEQYEEVLKDFGRTSETMKGDVEVIRKWVQTQPHLPETPCDEKIERFLLMNKFNIEKTKSKLDWYYTLKNKLPEFFQQDPAGEEGRRIMDAVYFIPMPRLTPDLSRIICIQKNTAVDEFDPLVYFAHTYNLAELRVLGDCCRGEVHIYDFGGFKMSHFTKMSPMLIKKAAAIFEKAYASRVKAFIMVNVPPILDTFVSLLKKCVPEKLTHRIHVFRDIEGIHDIVPKEYLPKDFGGEQKSFAELNENYKRLYLEKKAVFERLRSLKVDEKLRPGRPLYDDDIFGAYGNFRKIEVD